MDENVVIDNSRDLEVTVSKLLHRLGVPAHVKGYMYLRYGIILAVEDISIINSLTKSLYPSIAKKFGVTTCSVERAMRSAISISWERGDMVILNDYFGFTIDSEKGKPTNGEFIAMIADNIRLNS